MSDTHDEAPAPVIEVPTPAEPDQAEAEDLTEWMADLMAERSKVLAANEADNARRALQGHRGPDEGAAE